jgi:hypothetical protein
MQDLVVRELEELKKEIEKDAEKHMGRSRNLNSSSREQSRGRERTRRSPRRQRRAGKGQKDHTDAPVPKQPQMRAREQDRHYVTQAESAVRKQSPSKVDRGNQKAHLNVDDFAEQYASGANGPGPNRYNQNQEPPQIPRPAAMAMPVSAPYAGIAI